MSLYRKHLEYKLQAGCRYVTQGFQGGSSEKFQSRNIVLLVPPETLRMRFLCRQIDRLIGRQIDRQIDKQIAREIDRQIERKKERQIDRQIDRQLDRQIDRQKIDRQKIDRQIDRRRKKKEQESAEAIFSTKVKSRTDVGS